MLVTEARNLAAGFGASAVSETVMSCDLRSADATAESASRVHFVAVIATVSSALRLSAI